MTVGRRATELPASGPFTSAHAHAAGFWKVDIRRMLRGGSWVALRRGVYVDAGAFAEVVDDPRRRHALELAGLLLVVGCDAVACGTSAARLLDLETLAPPSAELVVVTGDPAVKGARRDGYLLRSAALPAHHRRIESGVPVTSPARTAVDLARRSPLVDGVVVIDSVLRQGLATPGELHEVLRRSYSWRGIARAQRAVELADRKAGSVLESVSRVAMYEQGLPSPRTQVLLGDSDGPFAEVDFLWDEFGVIGEADGLAKYAPRGGRTTREIIRAEKRREGRLLDLGYEVVRWGWEDACDSARLATRLRAAFARGNERRRGRRAGSQRSS